MANNDTGPDAAGMEPGTDRLSGDAGNTEAGKTAFSLMEGGEWKAVEPGGEAVIGGETVKLRAAFGADGNGAASENGFKVTAKGEPYTVTVQLAGAKASGGDSQPIEECIVIRWDPVEDGVTYNVYRGTDKDAPVLCAASLIDTCYMDRDIVHGKSYYYRITACQDIEVAGGGTENAFGEAAGEEAAFETGEENVAEAGGPTTKAEGFQQQTGAEGAFARNYPEIRDWRKYVYFKPERRGAYNYDINPIFLQRLAAMAKAYLKEKLYVTWGYRTHEEQALAHHIHKQHDGDFADSPGTSWHEYRLAVDVQTYIIRRLTNAALEPYGLCKPIPDVNMHIQPIETMDVCKQDMAGYAAKANSGFSFASGALIVQTVKCPFCGKVF